MKDSAQKRLDQLIEKFDTAMLVTTSLERMETDVQPSRELWKASMGMWFPEGEKDPHLTLILFNPEYAEYWDRSGWRKLEFWWEAGKAWVSGEATDDQALSNHAKVRPE